MRANLPAKANIISVHKLRSSFAMTFYKMTNGDILALQQRLGHKSITTTNIYAKAAELEMKNNLENDIKNVENDIKEVAKEAKKIQKEIQHTQEKYMSQAKLTLDEKVSELRAVAENQWKENQEKQQILRSNLEKQFEENSEKWVNSIVSDVLN